MPATMAQNSVVMNEGFVSRRSRKLRVGRARSPAATRYSVAPAAVAVDVPGRGSLPRSVMLMCFLPGRRCTRAQQGRRSTGRLCNSPDSVLPLRRWSDGVAVEGRYDRRCGGRGYPVPTLDVLEHM